MYEVRLHSRRVQRELRSLPEPYHSRVLTALHDLENEPRPQGYLKLEGDIYRIRVGYYRIFYLIDDANQRIEVGTVRRRSESTYRNITELFSL